MYISDKMKLTMSYKIVYTVILFLFIFGFQLKSFPLSSSKVAVILLFMAYIFSAIFEGGKILLTAKETKHIIVSLLILEIGAVLIPYLNNTGDYKISYSVLLFFIEDLVGSVLACRVFKRASIDDFIECYIMICLMQSVVILLMLFIPSVKTSIWTILENDNQAISNRYGGIRGLGIASSVTYDLGVVLSVGQIFIAIKWIRNNYCKITFDVVCFVVILLGIVLSGRTGLIGTLLSIVLIVIDLWKKGKIAKFGKVIAVASICALGSYAILVAIMPDEIFNSINTYVFELFYNYKATGVASTYTGRRLQEMYFTIPFKTFLFGDGYYIDPYTGRYYMSTDVGYMRHILFFGVFFSAVLYSIYIKCWKRIRNLQRENHSPLLILLTTLTIYFFIVNGKGDFLLGCRMGIKVYLVTYLLIYKVRYNKLRKFR